MAVRTSAVESARAPSRSPRRAFRSGWYMTGLRLLNARPNGWFGLRERTLALKRSACRARAHADAPASDSLAPAGHRTVGNHVEAIELGEAEKRRLRLMLAVEEMGFEGSQALLLEIELAAALGDGIAPGFVDLALDDERHGGSTLLPRSGVTAASCDRSSRRNSLLGCRIGSVKPVRCRTRGTVPQRAETLVPRVRWSAVEN